MSILILSSCGPSGPEKKRAESGPGALWYLFSPEGGRFLSQETLFARFPTPQELLLPWVNQLRGVNFFFREGRYFLGVNGLGLGEIVIDGTPRVVIHRDSHIFTGRTLGGLFLFQQGILAQLYGDSIFNSNIPDALPPLWHFDPQENRFVEVPGRKRHWSQGWELMELFPLGESRLERWKKSGDREVFFRYIRYTPSWDGQENFEEMLEEEAFRRLSRPPSLAEASQVIRSGWTRMKAPEDPERIRDLVFPGGTEIAGVIRLPGPQPEEVQGYTWLPSVVEGEELTTLFPREGILRGSAFPQKPLFLPTLPPACRYTSLGAFGKWWILGWEEVVFPRVGASGLLFIPRD